VIGKLTRIKWVDAVTESAPGWKAEAGFMQAKLSIAESVGWVIHEDDQLIVLVGSRNDAKQVDGDVTIPKAWIMEQVELEDVESIG
jgi:hypothetical protein